MKPNLIHTDKKCFDCRYFGASHICDIAKAVPPISHQIANNCKAFCKHVRIEQALHSLTDNNNKDMIQAMLNAVLIISIDADLIAKGLHYIENLPDSIPKRAVLHNFRKE